MLEAREAAYAYPLTLAPPVEERSRLLTALTQKRQEQARGSPPPAAKRPRAGSRAPLPRGATCVRNSILRFV